MTRSTRLFVLASLALAACGGSSRPSEPQATALPSVASGALTPSQAPRCPADMVLIDGAVAWLGPKGASAQSDEPRRRVAIPSFCLDRTEVPVRLYRQCVEQSPCSAPHDNGRSCTYHQDDRDDHPVNCVDHLQATTACRFWSKRLPSEDEWEFAARGGIEERVYSWGDAPPDDTMSCYAHPSTCKVATFPPGAFGLYDMTGNLWEWTDSQFLSLNGWNLPEDWRVYRGGSYSRRFPKWMKTWVRNRYRPSDWGAHLGFRCASSLDSSACPPLSHLGSSGRCLVDDSPASSHTHLAPSSSAKVPSTGSSPHPSPGAPSSSTLPDDRVEAPALLVTRERQFDSDCQTYHKGLPLSFRISGMGFADRQRKKRELGCTNRDVGASFNSVCCPSREEQNGRSSERLGSGS